MIKKYVFCMLLAASCQQTVMASPSGVQQFAGESVSTGADMMQVGSGVFTAPSSSWRPIIRRPQTTPPPPPPAQPLPSPRPSTSSSSSGRPNAYPGYLPGSDYGRRS